MEVVIDLGLIKKPDDFYKQLTSQVDLGDFFGCNLDAFWDYLGILEGYKLSFINYSQLSNEMNDLFIDIIWMLNEYNLNNIKLKLSAERLINMEIFDNNGNLIKP